MKCPDCDRPLKLMARDGSADKYVCEKHGAFRISDTAEARGFWDMPKDVRVTALQRARKTAAPGREPVIMYF